MKHVAVIGGGISGVAAALQLSQHDDLKVKLFEGKSRLGGVLETVQAGPYLVERSADNFATLIPDAFALTEEFGQVADLIRPEPDNRQAFVLRQGKLHPIPAGFSLMQPTRILAMLTTPTLSWRGKLRAVGEFWAAARKTEGDESLESFAIRRLGREAYENLVEPIVSGIFTADPKSLSMQATMPQFLAMERKHGGLIRGHLAARKDDAAAAARKASGARYDQFVAPKLGMSSWIEQLASSLPADCVQLDSPINQLQPTDNGWQIAVGETLQQFDGVVLATPAAISASLLAAAAPDAAALLRDIPYASSAVVAMIVNKRDLTGRIDGFGMITPSKENRHCLAISYTSNKYSGRVPDDEILLRVFLGGALRPHVIDFDDEQLISMATDEVRDILGWRGDQPNWQTVVRWRNAMPQYLVGHVDRITKLNRLLSEFPTLQLCGAAYSGVGIPQCVRSAKKAVAALRSHFAPQ